jgi:hypothetical protein
MNHLCIEHKALLPVYLVNERIVIRAIQVDYLLRAKWGEQEEGGTNVIADVNQGLDIMG